MARSRCELVRRIGRRVVTDEQRLAKAAQPDEVEILFARKRIERGQERLCLAGNPRDVHRVQLRFGEVAQAMTRCVLGERMEEDRLVRHGEIVVAELAVAVLRDRTQFRAHGLVRFVRRRAAVGDEAGELPRGIESGARVFDVIDVVVQDVPGGLAHATAGQDVEAHVQDAVIGEAFGSEREQRVAHLRLAPTNTRRARR